MGRGRSGKKKGGGGFRQLTDSEEQKYYSGQTITAAQQAAFDKYTDPNTEPGSLYNFSQNMNMAVAQGQPLTPEQQQVWDEISGSMHDLGQDMQLTRYDHADTVDQMLRGLGVRGSAEYMTADELKGYLVGAEYEDKRILSTSVNGFANASDPSTFTTRQFKFTYEAESNVQGVMPGRGNIGFGGYGKGDDFGEMLLGGSSKYTVKDVRYSGAKARSKGMPKSYLTEDQIEIVVGVRK